MPGSLYRVENTHPDAKEEEQWSAISRHADAIRTKDELAASVYKLFSEKKLEELELYKLFEFSFTVLKRKEWKGAYPKFNPPEQFADIRLTPKGGGKSGKDTMGSSVFYLNALEAAASAMEISAISAKNIAQLIANDLEPAQANRAGQSIVEEDIKSEL